MESRLELPTRPLQPFGHPNALKDFSLNAGAIWHDQRLLVRFELSGPLQQLRIPAPATPAQRRDGLWQSTCVEAFVGVRGQAAYWEINLCPSGHWNLYGLTGYRQDLRPETAVQTLPLKRQQGWHEADRWEHLSLAFELPLQVDGTDLIWGPRTPDDSLPGKPLATELEISATAVLDHQQHGCSYWAWRHTTNEADFHQRSSFVPLQQRFSAGF